MKLTALDLYILTDTVLHSLAFGKSWTGSANEEPREKILEKLQMILNEMSVEIVTQSPDPVTITSDMGV